MNLLRWETWSYPAGGGFVFSRPSRPYGTVFSGVGEKVSPPNPNPSPKLSLVAGRSATKLQTHAMLKLRRLIQIDVQSF